MVRLASRSWSPSNATQHRQTELLQRNPYDRADRFADDDHDDARWAEDPAFEKFRRAKDPVGRRIAADGKSGRIDVAEPERAQPDSEFDADQADSRTARFSSYDVAAHGPEPIPEWVITSFSAVDTPLGILKTGKEADVHLLERALPGGPSTVLAVKTYRTSEHRMFHRDSGYQEGRRTRRTRETRAMATRTAFGRELLAGKWAFAEFEALCRLWTAGAAVPYPIQLIGSELMMEFIGTPDGFAAPRLAAVSPPEDAVPFFEMLWHDLVGTLELLASMGFTHGDLSPYNVLVDGDQCVLIDLPQVVDVIGNPQGLQFLARDAANIASFFHRRGVDEADADLLTAKLVSQAGL